MIFLTLISIGLHNNEFKLRCPVCRAGYNSKLSLDCHVDKHRQRKRFTCTKCNKSFRWKNSLQQHLQNCGIVGGHHVCQVCKKSFKSKSFFALHVRSHSNPHSFKCNMCTKSYPYLLSLQQHKRTHISLKHNTCTQCGKVFACRSMMLRHQCQKTQDAMLSSVATDVYQQDINRSVLLFQYL